MELLIKGVPYLIDDVDYDVAREFKWDTDRYGYARTRYQIEGKVRTIYLHHLVIGRKKGFIVDHINRDIKDNRKANLRHVTYYENNQNRKSKNYSYDKKRNKWAVDFMRFGKRYRLGRFNSEDEAKEVVKQWTLSHS